MVRRNTKGHFDIVLHSGEDGELGFDNLLGNTCSCHDNHALGRYHLIIAGRCIIVKNTSYEAHQADDIIGSAFKEDATDCHMSIPSTKLIW